jgi:hypothetical protein
VKSQTESVAAKVSETVRDQVAEMMDRVAGLERRLLGLASAEQVASALQLDRETMEHGFAAQTESLQTLSGSVGAMYVRVRAMEHAYDEQRKKATEDEARLHELMVALKDVMALEQRLTVRIASMESRIGDAEVLRDREFAALLAELSDMVAKGDRARFAEKLRLFERRRGEGVPSDVTG